jgi:hypothetical protein
VLDLERVLADDDSDYPPMRQPGGTLVELRTFTPFAMHQLAANGANGERIPPVTSLLRRTCSCRCPRPQCRDD